MFEHLHYCIQEIDTAYQFIQIDNIDFYKRSISRLIIVRVADFIKIAENINNPGSLSELAILKKYYKDNLEVHRHKLGAHFQYLDLGKRLELWSAITLDKVDFLYKQVIKVYNLHSNDSSFISFIQTIIDNNDRDNILLINNDLNIEKHPNMSSDILAMSRPNSGGLLHFSYVADKAGVLKSIELLITYNISILKCILRAPKLKELFVKLFVNDLTSYVDNFYTRTDIQESAPQYEKGFSDYITREYYPEVYKIVNEFKANYKLEEHITSLRKIRNKTSSHIDTTLSVINLSKIINEIDIDKYVNFYLQLKNTFKKICHTDITLGSFAIEPTTKLHGSFKIPGLEYKSFDGAPTPEYIYKQEPLDNEEIYQEQFDKWVIDNCEDTQNYFWHAFSDSPLIEKISHEVKISEGTTFYEHNDYRKVHAFFERKLVHNETPLITKNKILELFISNRSGYPYILSYILNKTYPREKELQVGYINAIGFLAKNRDLEILKKAKELFYIDDFYDKVYALKCIFRIDIRSRRDVHGNCDIEENEYSKFIKTELNIMSEPEKLYFSIILGSELFHNLGGIQKFKTLYYRYFESLFCNSITSLTKKFIKNTHDKQKIERIKKYFKKNRFTTITAMCGEYFTKNKQEIIGKSCFGISYEQLIEYPKDDPMELHNLGVIAFKLGDMRMAISIANFLIKQHSYKADYYYFLLSLYVTDRKYEFEFKKTKEYVLTNFNLKEENKKQFIDLDYNV